MRKLLNRARQATVRLRGAPPPPLPQLVMWYPHREPPVVAPLPAGYRGRAYRPGDETGWLDLLAANGQLGEWSMERLQRELQGALLVDAQQFILRGETVVAAAGVYARRRAEQEAWEIGWVAAHPQHAGRGLGSQVTATAVSAALRLPPRPVFLLTDDFRVPALKVYLKLGFVPDLQHPTYRARWQRIFAELGDKYSSYRVAAAV